MVDEMTPIESNHTWASVLAPPGKSTVDCRWIFIVKVGLGGLVNHWNVCLVKKGYTQIYGLDYTNTLSVAKMASIHLFLSKAA